MIVQARQARTAYTYAPLQERRSQAAGWLRWRYAPWIRLWVDACWDQTAAGTTVSQTNDCSGNNVSITQSGAVSKRPVKSSLSNIEGFTFAGNASAQGLVTPAINLSTTSQITIATVNNMTSNPQSFLYEISTNMDTSTEGAHMARSGSALNDFGGGVRGNFGYNYKYAPSTLNTWYSHLVVIDKAAAVLNEVTLYQNGALSAGAGVTNNNTNTFGNLATFIGSRNNGSAGVFNGSISQIILFTIALSASQSADVGLLLRQRVGSA